MRDIYIFVVVPPHCIVDERGKSFRRVDLCFKGPFLCLSGSTDVVLSVPDKLGQIGQQSSEDAFSLMKAKHFKTWSMFLVNTKMPLRISWFVMALKLLSQSVNRLILSLIYGKTRTGKIAFWWRMCWAIIIFQHGYHLAENWWRCNTKFWDHHTLQVLLSKPYNRVEKHHLSVESQTFVSSPPKTVWVFSFLTICAQNELHIDSRIGDVPIINFGLAFVES